jgi:hypothetical protein
MIADKISKALEFKSFEQFYPYYLGQHSNPTNKMLHMIGTTMAILSIITSVVLGNVRILLLTPIFGYGFAWVGHFCFQKNRPATFQYPMYSLMGDFRMYWEFLTQKIG